jgi:hypothetical protein
MSLFTTPTWRLRGRRCVGRKVGSEDPRIGPSFQTLSGRSFPTGTRLAEKWASSGLGGKEMEKERTGRDSVHYIPHIYPVVACS